MNPDLAEDTVKLPLPTPGLLRQKAYWLFWVARVASGLAFQGAAVLIGWRVYELTHSAYMLGLVGLIQFLPMLLLNFVVGQVADRLDRRRIILLCQCVEALALLTAAFGIAGGWLGVWGLYAVVATMGAARAFEGPTTASILPAIVAEAQLPQALSMSIAAMQAAIIIGPTVGGLLYGLNPSLAFLVGAVCFAVAACAVGWLHIRRAITPKEPLTLQSVFAGITFIKHRPVILGTLSLDLFAGILGGITSLLPIFAHDILHTGPWGAGLLRGAVAAGALVMSVALMKWTITRHVGLKMFAAVIVFGLATVVFSFSTSLVLSCAALAVLGASDMISVVIRNSLVLLNTPDHMRGRVNAVNFLFIGTSNQLGDFESGMVAGLIGAVPAGVFGGAATVVLTLLWMKLFPSLRKADRFSGET